MIPTRATQSALHTVELLIGGMSALQVTHLCLVNLGLEVLPSAIGDLAALQELCLGRNMLGACSTSLPDSITKLTRSVHHSTETQPRAA